MNITKKYINTSQNHRLYCQMWEDDKVDEKLSPILLLHDSIGSVALWRDFPEMLAGQTRRKIIAYDRLGHGFSDAKTFVFNEHFISEESSDYFPQILKAMDCDTFLVMGHSVGGAMAIYSASQYHPQCLAVITESAQAFVEEITLEGIENARSVFQQDKVYCSLEKYHGKKTQTVLDAWIKSWLDERFRHWHLKDVLPAVKCPLLAIHGENDEYGSQSQAEILCQYVSGASQIQIIANAGHVPHREYPHKVLETIVQFLHKYEVK